MNDVNRAVLRYATARYEDTISFIWVIKLIYG